MEIFTRWWYRFREKEKESLGRTSHLLVSNSGQESGESGLKYIYIKNKYCISSVDFKSIGSLPYFYKLLADSTSRLFLEDFSVNCTIVICFLNDPTFKSTGNSNNSCCLPPKNYKVP